MRRVENLLKTSPVGFAYQPGWRGFRLATLGVVLLTLAAPGIGLAAAEQRNNRTEEPAVAALPMEVREALDRAARVHARPLSGARWSEVNLLSGTDHPLYQLQGKNDRGNKIEIEVTGAGRVLEVEEHGIPLREVPRAVVEALKAKRPQFEPTLVEAIFQAEKARPVAYGFEGKDAAGRKIEVYIGADGKTFVN